MPDRPKLRVAIECRIGDVRQGIGTTLISLARSLSALESGDQEYSFLVSDELAEWLAPHVFGASRLVVRSTLSGPRWKRLLRELGPVRRVSRWLRSSRLTVPVSDGFLEEQGFDLIHFPTQVAYRTSVPSIYQPWDLQHVHHPEFFSTWDVALREMYYRAFCEQAACVCVSSEWTRNDLIQCYGLDAAKIAVIRWGSMFAQGESPTPATVAETASRLNLPGRYLFYPAATWPHKNHRVLLHALHALRTKHGLQVALCLTGAQGSEHDALRKLGRELNVDGLVHELGFVSAEVLRWIYTGGAAMVFPSRFEGYGLPILEAFQMGTPVLCSRATVLPETAEDGAAYFDADSADELAELMAQVLDEPEFGRRLVERGSAVLGRSTMESTARGFQELYRHVCGGEKASISG